MKFNKLSFAIGNIFGAVVVGTMITACGSGPYTTVLQESTTTQNTTDIQNGNTKYGAILASKIILAKQTLTPKGNVIRIQANQLPENVEVLASQVVVDTTNNTLESTNLQTALDTEIAVDLTTNIVGTWNIENISTDSVFGSGPTVTGQVEFKSDGTFVVMSGGFAAPGTTVTDAPWLVTNFTDYMNRASSTPGLKLCDAVSSINRYRVVDGVIQFTLGSRNSLTTVLKNSSDNITLMGFGGGCNIGHTISRLTRVVTATPSSLKSKPSKYIPSKPVGKVALAG